MPGSVSTRRVGISVCDWLPSNAPVNFAKPKSRYLHAPIIRDENVVWFDVTMDDSFLVRRSETVRYLQCIVQRMAGAALPQRKAMDYALQIAHGPRCGARERNRPS